MNIRKNIESTQTIVYGGAFDPPTRAHQAILQSCIEYAEPLGGEVWLLPSASRIDKSISTPEARRIELCEALARDVTSRNVQLRVDTTELSRPKPTETYETVCEFAEEYPEREFTWVFGADSLQTMRSWYGGEWMYDNLSMLVVPRPGSPVGRLGRYARCLAMQPSDISSTVLRTRISEDKPFNDLVGSEVYKLLTEKNEASATRILPRET